MGFLQPWILLALPLAIVPIIIHFVNQWRYQTKPWAAMMFLLRAKTMHRGFDRLRQWIILALRVAAVLGIVFAASRPISSGTIAWLAGGDMDTVMVLMDCSPSMLATGRSNQLSKHQTAINQLRTALAVFNASKWVMVDSNTLVATEYASAEEMLDSLRTQTSDAACDWPAMLESAISYLDRKNPTQSHIWMVSDLQSSSFAPNSPRWESIRERLLAKTKNLRFTSIEYPDQPLSNYSIRVSNARWATNFKANEPATVKELDLLLSVVVEQFSQDASNLTPTTQSISVTVDWQGNETRIPLELTGGRGELIDYVVGSVTSGAKGSEARTDQSISLDNVQTWGRVRIPLDGNVADNEDFFAVDADPIAKVLVVTNRPESLLPVIAAAEAPADPLMESQVNVVSPSVFNTRQLDELAFVIWQSELPTQRVAEPISQFVERGGSLWVFPPDQIGTPEKSSGTSFSRSETDSDKPNTLFDFSWGPWQGLQERISPTTWQSDNGLLRATQSGSTLEVGELRVSKLATILGKSIAIVSFADGKALVASRGISSKEMILWTTLPTEEFSTLGYSSDSRSGVVLYVAVQRAIESGRQSLATVVNRVALPDVLRIGGSSGSNSENISVTSLPEPSEWIPLLSTERFRSNQLSCHAGVFRAGSKIVSIHRPMLENDSKTLGSRDWGRLFSGIPVKRVTEETGSGKDLQSEAWRGFMVLLISAMLVEAAMSLPKK